MNNKAVKTIGISLLFFIIGLVVVKYYINKAELEKGHRITIGTVYDFVIGSRSGYILDYNFSVNGKDYKCDDVVYSNPESLVNKRFFVVFSPSNPKNSKILLDKPVSNELKQAPLEGWTEIPK